MKNTFNDDTPNYDSGAPQTPYLRAKQVWDARMANFALGALHWRYIALISFALTLVLLILLLISLSWHKPNLYIAEVSEAGQVMNVKMLAQDYQPTEAQEEYFIVQFIKLVQGVSLDPVAAKNNWLMAYNFLTKRGAEVLNAYFQKNNPLAALQKKTVTVNVTDINPLSKNSYEVDWTEESVGLNGQVMGERQMSGVFTITVDPPRTKEQMLQNPLGIYIVDFHMSPRVASGQ